MKSKNHCRVLPAGRLLKLHGIILFLFLFLFLFFSFLSKKS
jgi:hypothetical protein